MPWAESNKYGQFGHWPELSLSIIFFLPKKESVVWQPSFSNTPLWLFQVWCSRLYKLDHLKKYKKNETLTNKYDKKIMGTSVSVYGFA